MKKYILPFILGFMVTFASAAPPQTDRATEGAQVWGTLLPQAQVDQIVANAMKYSRYKTTNGQKLRIDVVEFQTFNDKACGVGKTECDTAGFYNDNWATDMVHVQAMPKGQTEWSNGMALDEVMVHEAVHWLQFVNGDKFPNWEDDCADLAAAEAEAYVADYMYAVEEKGKHDMAFFMPDIYGMCRIRQTFFNGGAP
jgi:hypothetical protein